MNLPISRRIGLLQRRHVSVGQIIYIGRESNQLEEVEAGTVHDAAGVYTEYVDPQRETWFRAAQVVSVKEWERETDKPRRLLIDARLGRRRPHRQHRELIVAYCAPARPSLSNGPRRAISSA
jgi:hypothetical protein